MFFFNIIFKKIQWILREWIFKSGQFQFKSPNYEALKKSAKSIKGPLKPQKVVQAIAIPTVGLNKFI